MNNQECNIVRDILPLYVEDIVSEDTKQFVEEHLSSCEECRTELKKTQTDVIVINDNSEIDASADVIKKSS